MDREQEKIVLWQAILEDVRSIEPLATWKRSISAMPSNGLGVEQSYAAK